MIEPAEESVVREPKRWLLPLVKRQTKWSASSSAALPGSLAIALAVVLLLTACGQRGPLYIPGKPGDPAYDRQNRGSTPASSQPGTQPGSQPAAQPGSQPSNEPSNTNPPPSVPNDNRAKRDEVS